MPSSSMETPVKKNAGKDAQGAGRVRFSMAMALILGVLTGACCLGADSIETVSGELMEVIFNPTGESYQTNGYSIRGVRRDADFLIRVEPDIGDVQTIWEVGSETEVVRAVSTYAPKSIEPPKTNINAYVEPYLLPRLATRATKVAVLGVTRDLGGRIAKTRFPIFMSDFPAYPIHDVTYETKETGSTTTIEAKLLQSGKQNILWHLEITRTGADDDYKLDLDFRTYSHVFNEKRNMYPLLRTIQGAVNFSPSKAVVNSFRPALSQGQNIVDFTLVNQDEILQAIDNSSKIGGGVACIATNTNWDYDRGKAQDAAILVKTFVIRTANYEKGSKLKTAFGLIVITFFIVPLVFLWRSRSSIRGTNQQKPNR